MILKPKIILCLAVVLMTGCHSIHDVPPAPTKPDVSLIMPSVISHSLISNAAQFVPHPVPAGVGNVTATFRWPVSTRTDVIGRKLWYIAVNVWVETPLFEIDLPADASNCVVTNLAWNSQYHYAVTEVYSTEPHESPIGDSGYFHFTTPHAPYQQLIGAQLDWNVATQVQVQASSDLTRWQPLTNVNATGCLLTVDQSEPQEFYRLATDATMLTEHFTPLWRMVVSTNFCLDLPPGFPFMKL
jgi:hypothetical protein